MVFVLLITHFLATGTTMAGLCHSERVLEGTRASPTPEIRKLRPVSRSAFCHRNLPGFKASSRLTHQPSFAQQLGTDLMQ